MLSTPPLFTSKLESCKVLLALHLCDMITICYISVLAHRLENNTNGCQLDAVIYSELVESEEVRLTGMNLGGEIFIINTIHLGFIPCWKVV